MSLTLSSIFFVGSQNNIFLNGFELFKQGLFNQGIWGGGGTGESRVQLTVKILYDKLAIKQ